MKFEWDLDKPARNLAAGKTTMSARRPSVLEQFVREAARLGADTLEVEYSDGYEEVVAYVGAVGREIGRLASGTAEARALRSALYASTTRPRRLSVEGHEHVIRARVYDNFGEDAFRINLGRSSSQLQERLAGSVRGPRDLSSRKGFSRS